MDAAAFCVAGVALGDMDLHFAWQAWHLVTWIVTLRGRPCVALMALGWLWWRAWVPVDAQLVPTPLTHTHNLLIQLCHIQLFHTQHFYIHKLTHTTLSHTALSPNLSCTISFPSCLSHLISHLLGDHWKKLICGVTRSFNLFFLHETRLRMRNKLAWL